MVDCAEQPLGFDLKDGAILTACSGSKAEQCELHGYDLVTGERKISIPFSLNPSGPEELTSWKAILSSDNSTIACWKLSGTTIQVFDVRKQYQQTFSIKDKERRIESIGLSSNGELFAISDSTEVQVWECRTGKIKCRLSMPAETDSGMRHGMYRCHPESIQFSSDGLYPAVGGYGNGIAVFNLLTGQGIGHCLQASIPLFLSDSRTLIALSSVVGNDKVQWYQIENETLKPTSLSAQIDPFLERLLGASPRGKFF